MHAVNRFVPVLLLCGLTSPLEAQVPWESPQMLAPGVPAGIGILFVDYGLAPDDGIGVLINYRTNPAPGGIGLRFAATRGEGNDDPRFSGGIDASVPVFQHSPEFPLDVIWTTGAGASYGDYLQFAAPVGFAVGRVLDGPTIWFNPYISTRVVFEAYMGDDRPDDEFGMALASDLGADVSFGRARTLLFRFAASLGDRHALVAGIHIATGY